MGSYIYYNAFWCCLYLPMESLIFHFPPAVLLRSRGALIPLEGRTLFTGSPTTFWLVTLPWEGKALGLFSGPPGKECEDSQAFMSV